MTQNRPYGSQQALFGSPQTVTTSDDYYTPPWVFERLGLTFDLDVAAPPGGVDWVPASRFYTIEDDGLSRPWHGRVWMNPPYSQATPWVQRFIDHGHGVALLPFAKSTWLWDLWGVADGITPLPRRNQSFVGGDVMLPVFLAAFGVDCVEAIARIGSVRRLRDKSGCAAESAYGTRCVLPVGHDGPHDDDPRGRR